MKQKEHVQAAKISFTDDVNKTKMVNKYSFCLCLNDERYCCSSVQGKVCL